jgi:hypothetical protein
MFAMLCDHHRQRLPVISIRCCFDFTTDFPHGGEGLIFSLYRLIFDVYGPICIISAISAATARQSSSGHWWFRLISRLSKVRGSCFLEATDFCHAQTRQIHRCIFAPVTSVHAHSSVLTTPFDMVNAHYVIIDFRAKFFIKIQNQASDTSRSLPSFSSAP